MKPIYEEIKKSDYDSNNMDITRLGDTLKVDLTYPDMAENRVKFVEVNQESVRASDGIRLHYDYNRDGWVVMQPTRSCWDVEGDNDMRWEETAFIQSWALREKQKAWERGYLTPEDANLPTHY